MEEAGARSPALVKPTSEDDGLVVDVIVTRVLDFAQRSGTHTVRIAARDDPGTARRSGEDGVAASATARAEGGAEEEGEEGEGDASTSS